MVYQTLNAQVGFDRAEWERRVPAFKLLQVDARYCLQEAAQPVTNNYFIIKGLVRFYYFTPEGKELNKGFYAEHNMVGNLSAMVLNERSRFVIETLEPSVLLQMPLDKAQLKTLDSGDSCWNRFFNYCCRMMLIRNERREAELLTLSAKERLQQFIKNCPDLWQRIPQYHIASYLGITPVALSKYKNTWLESTAD